MTYYQYDLRHFQRPGQAPLGPPIPIPSPPMSSRQPATRPSPARSDASTFVNQRTQRRPAARPTPSGYPPRSSIPEIFRAPNKASSTTTSRSVENWPAYQHLYAKDAKAISNFLLYAQPLSYKNLESNKAYKAAIVSLEPGPKIDYVHLPEHIRNVSLTFSYTDVYRGLDTYLERILNAHTTWVKAAMQYYSYEVYKQMIHGLFHTNSDPALLALTKDMTNSSYARMKENIVELSSPRSRHTLDTELARLGTLHTQRRDVLHKLKVCPHLPHNLAVLKHATAMHEQHRLESRAELAARAEHARQIKAASHAFMMANPGRQFGQIATQNWAPHVETAMLAYNQNIIDTMMPHFSEGQWERDCEEYEDQKKKWKCLNGFEVGLDAWGNETGKGRDAESGVWYGDDRMDM